MSKVGDSAGKQAQRTTVEWFVEIDGSPDDHHSLWPFESWLSEDPRREGELARCEAALFLAKELRSAVRMEEPSRRLTRTTRAWMHSAASAVLVRLKSPRLAWSITAMLFLITVSVMLRPEWPQAGGAVKPDASADAADGLAAALASPNPAVVLPTQVVVDAGSLAVVPFTVIAPGNAPGGRQARVFASRLYASVLRRLASIPGIYVADRQSVLPYAGTDMAVEELAAQLGVRAIVQGRVESADERLRVALRLTDASNGKLVWQSTFERPVGDVSSIGNDMATDLASALAAANPSGRQ